MEIYKDLSTPAYKKKKKLLNSQLSKIDIENKSVYDDTIKADILIHLILNF